MNIDSLFSHCNHDKGPRLVTVKERERERERERKRRKEKKKKQIGELFSARTLASSQAKAKIALTSVHPNVTDNNC